MKTVWPVTPGTASASSARFTILLLVTSPWPSGWEMATRLCDAPPSAHHRRALVASTIAGFKATSPSGSTDPLRAPCHSLMRTFLRPTTGWLSSAASSILALSPQSTTLMLHPVSSAIMISRFASSVPSLAVMDMRARASVTTPQRSTLHGTFRVLSEEMPEMENLKLWIWASSATSSACHVLSKTSSYLWLVLLYWRFATRTVPLLRA
mmetsp:Transcript_125321/g.348702  ORF Transcript_125321/g.348702 Transcript_125321/m.348702 type:complete len:209 (-) Transcript_125321:276-902(-)